MTLLLVIACSKEEEGPANPEIEKPVAEVPVAVDDEITTAENTEIIIEGLLENDTSSEFIRITEIDQETVKGGTVVDNRDGTYTYQPPMDFIGEDSFEYSICNTEDTPGCDTATVNITVTAASPSATDDAYEVVEEGSLVINNFLQNDALLDGATVTEVHSEDASGTIELQADGDIFYTAAAGFTGEDIFSYTICDDDQTPACANAEIKIAVIDEGNPVVQDDAVVVSADGGINALDYLLANDDTVDDAVVTSVSQPNNGTTSLTAEGTITYTPAAGYKGTDRFTYTLCDDDMPAYCGTATVEVSVVEPLAFTIPAEIQDYYSQTSFTSDHFMLFEELETLSSSKHNNQLEYIERHDYLYEADASLSDPEYVVLMYTGEQRPRAEYQQGNLSEGETFNTEHIFPQSKLESEIAKSDLHLLRVADVDINSKRSNYPFTAGNGEAKLVNGNSWYPGDQWKGDVARIVMYTHLRYGEEISEVGNLELFLQWNAEDPVSAFELQRNEVIETAQGNRNPFIDNPYLATLLWDGPAAENRW